MALMIAVAQSDPGRTSRGASQQRMPARSKRPQTASAMGLSWLE
jgi:hypothetical protein